MMGERPELPLRLQQSAHDDDSTARDGDRPDIPTEAIEDEGFVHLNRSLSYRSEKLSESRSRSASPPAMLAGISSGQTLELLRAEEMENSVDNFVEDSAVEDDDREELDQSVVSETSETSESGTSTAGSPERPLITPQIETSDLAGPKNSGFWRYDHKYGDYVQKRPDGNIMGYREYQQRAKASTAKAAEFSVIDKPKRFYTFGRIFKLNWADPPGDGKPVPRQRWFVVVRRRLHHSLCFAITTGGGSSFNGNGSGKSRGKSSGGNAGHRGRSRDFVVLFPAGFLPPAADEEEGIERDPVGVIIEDAEQCISPQARLDCARIYTVEFDVAVVKIGRVDTKDFEKLEEYYQECIR